MKVFSIIDISEQDVDFPEQMGTKSKFWFTDKNSGTEFLFKSTHTEDKYQNPIIRVGENWSEKIACEIACELGIPHAKYDLAVNKGEHGIVSQNFCSLGDELTFGNSLIEHIVKDTLEEPLEQGQRSQTVARVSDVLKKIVVDPPIEWTKTKNIKDALDVFIGYLMFDALISNQDRHNENWAMITDINGNKSLAPSFDHAASLGRSEIDEKRITRLETKDKGSSIETFVSRCKSHFYDGNKRLKTLDAFTYFSAISPSAGLEWLERLGKLDLAAIDSILKAIPDEIMSEISKRFCLAMINRNKSNLLSCKHEILKIKKEFEE